MSQLDINQTRLRLEAIASAIALVLIGAVLFVNPQPANATTSTYCNNQTLSNYNICYGGARNLEAVLGWGDNHSVCVNATGHTSWTCSSGPGQSTFNSGISCAQRGPEIQDNATGSNVVHGVAYNCEPPKEEGGGGGGEAPYRYMLGTSNGSVITSWNTLLSGMSKAESMAVGDVNADGKMDVVGVEPEYVIGKCRYMLGISNGSEISWDFTNLNEMTCPIAMALGDINGDGKADIVAVESEGNGKYRYMIGISDGRYFSWKFTNLTGMSKPIAMALGDINGDGKADIVAVESEGNGKYRYMRGISNGSSFSWGTTNLTGMSLPRQMSLGDVNGDGKADIVATEQSGGYYNYMRGISDGWNFAWNFTNLSGMWTPYQMSLGDLNGDGKADIVAVEAHENNPATGQYEYRRGISTGSSFEWGTALTGLSEQKKLGVGDITGDKKADVVSVEQY
jgi:hypothetical protein